jgi:ribonuclease E
MPNKMLIDASHPEETRVVVLRGNRVEEFDFEAASKKQLRGNIYLAKVTRVEPSLQAAFVDYGGNRHGFLAFSEIHPDYYQIPVADRQALLAEEAQAQRDEEEYEARSTGRRRSRRHGEGRQAIEKRSRAADESVSEALPEPVPPAHAAEEEREALPVHDDTSAAPNERFEAEDAGEAQAEAGQAEDVTAEHPLDVRPDGPETVGTSSGTGVEATAPDEATARSAAETEISTAAKTAEAAALAEVRTRSETATAESPFGDAPTEAPAIDEEPEAADFVSEAPEADLDRGNVEEIEDRHSEDEESDEDEHDDESPPDDDEEGEPPPVEQIGGDALEEIPYRSQRPRRQYKIQEVIKRRQVLLVQVAKEERGTKGAALTTYLSLAGRYSVLMPNTARGGGISRKITNALDRKRLKAIAEELEVPEGMGIILRTAGATRTKAEVKRDFEYLLRMWETVREVTLRSTAPTLVYEEGSLIKRAIRDLYNKDIDEVIVAGDEGYKEAKDYMRMLIPSHAKNIKPYADVQPIFARAGAEAQLDAMFTNQVTLKSGGYLVINQTEALVAIDVNSGRSTREHNIEDTALRTNLEAADEVARQLRLRDLAGLIVVDFIDMEEGRNNRAVERRMKEALKNDRARIQIGRISHFGLLEMSRQRIRTGVLEGSTIVCPHCMGAGMVRATSSIALHVLRGLEDALIKNAQFNILVRTRSEVALYILNQKRSHLRELENRFGVSITVAADGALTGTTYYAIERGEPAVRPIEIIRHPEIVRIDSLAPMYDDEAPDLAEAEEEEEEEADESASAEADETGEDVEPTAIAGQDEAQTEESDAARRRRKRRRRRGRDRDGRSFVSPNAPQPSDEGLAVVGEIAGEMPHYDANRAPVLADDDVAIEGRPVLEGSDAAVAVPEIREPHPRRHRRSRQRGDRQPPRDPSVPVLPLMPLEDAQQPTDAGFDLSQGQNPPLADAPSPVAEPTDEASDAVIVRHPAAPPAVATEPAAEAQEFAHAATEPTALSLAEPESSAMAESPGPASDTIPPSESTAVSALSEHAPDTASVEPSEAVVASAPEPAVLPPEPAPVEPDRPKRTGWWQRAKATFGG